MTAYILYSYYLDAKGEKITIGGVQTYLTNLSYLLREMNYTVMIYQLADEDFERDYQGVKVVGVKGRSHKGYVTGQLLYDSCKSKIDATNDIIIFGTDTLNVSCPGYKTISIQHGVNWDRPQKDALSTTAYVKEYCKKAFDAWKVVKRIAYVDSLVCVDNNFINWYRAIVPYPKTRLKAIMNFTDIPDEEIIQKSDDKINIIFARRLVEYRGTKVFAEAITRILSEYDNVYVTIAGSGPDEKWMKDRLKGFNNVTFTSYSSGESISFHADKHIAVVPTVGSEGTSLSLLEAMACGCAVICSNVGGMTNIVLNGYNGIIIEPTAEALYNALRQLLNDPNELKSLGRNGREVVKKAFSKERWLTEWKGVIEDIQSKR